MFLSSHSLPIINIRVVANVKFLLAFGFKQRSRIEIKKLIFHLFYIEIKKKNNKVNFFLFCISCWKTRVFGNKFFFARVLKIMYFTRFMYCKENRTVTSTLILLNRNAISKMKITFYEELVQPERYALELVIVR